MRRSTKFLRFSCINVYIWNNAARCAYSRYLGCSYVRERASKSLEKPENVCRFTTALYVKHGRSVCLRLAATTSCWSEATHGGRAPQATATRFSRRRRDKVREAQKLSSFLNLFGIVHVMRWRCRMDFRRCPSVAYPGLT